mgnify:CR=1 FL=1
MEYCDLGSMEDYMRTNKTVTEGALREIASCCLLGLAYLHSHNFSHGVIHHCSDKGIEHQTVKSVLIRGGCCETG